MWKVLGSNPGEGEISRTRPKWPWCPPSLPRKKAPCLSQGVTSDCPPPSRAEVKQKLHKYSSLTLWPSWPVLGRTFADEAGTSRSQTYKQMHKHTDLAKPRNLLNPSVSCVTLTTRVLCFQKYKEMNFTRMMR